MKTILIAIGGASCSGKTLLAKQLSQLLPASLIHQDDFAPTSSTVPIHPIHNVQDWDDPETCVDWERFRSTLQYIKQHGNLPPDHASYDHLNDSGHVSVTRPVVTFPKARYILVDGFVLFWDEEVRKLMDVELLLRAPREVLARRREERSYALQNAEDAEQGTVWTDPPGYFDNIVYPAYIKAHESVFTDGVESELKDERITLIQPDEGEEGIAEALEVACKAILEYVDRL